MIGAGSLIISHIEGWAACREAYMSMEFDMRPDKTAKKTLIVDFKNLFNCIGIPGGIVKGVFKFDNGNYSAFSAQLLGKSRLSILGEVTNDYKSILAEVRKWNK